MNSNWRRCGADTAGWCHGWSSAPRVIGIALALLLGSLAPAASEIAQPVPLHRIDSCAQMKEVEFVTVVALHSDYLDDWNRIVASQLADATSVWRAAVAPSRKLPTASMARSAAAGLATALRSAADRHSTLFESCRTVTGEPMTFSSLGLDAACAKFLHWNLGDPSGAQVGFPMRDVSRAVRGWSRTPGELDRVAAELDQWSPLMEKRAQIILSLPERFAEAYALAGVPPRSPVAVLSDSEQLAIRSKARDVFSTVKAELEAWRLSAVRHAFASAAKLSELPVIERAMILSACQLSGDPEVRDLARRELAALVSLGPHSRDENVAEQVSHACVGAHGNAAQWLERACARPQAGTQPDDEDRPVTVPQWRSDWLKSIAALEALSRGRARLEDENQPGRQAIEAWDASLLRLSLPPRTLVPAIGCVPWMERALDRQGTRGAEARAAIERAMAEEQAMSGELEGAQRLIAAIAAERGDSRPSSQEISQASRDYLQALREFVGRRGAILNGAALGAGLPPEDAEFCERAWRCIALASVRFGSTEPVESAPAALTDAVEIGLEEGVPLTSLRTSYWKDHLAQRESLLSELAANTALQVAALGQEFIVTDAGGEPAVEVEAAARRLSTNRDQLLRRLCDLNQSAIEQIRLMPDEAGMRAALRIEAAAYPSVEAVRVVVARATESRAVADAERLSQALCALQANVAARCCAETPEARRAATAQVAAALGRIVHLLDAGP